VIQRQLGHADLAITSRYLRGIDNTEIIAAVHERAAPMVPADPLTRVSRLAADPPLRADARPSRMRAAARRPGAATLSRCLPLVPVT
jgi:hypothetical protein